VPTKVRGRARYRLRADAMDWLASRNREWQNGRRGKPRYGRIAEAAGLNGPTLLRTISGDLWPTNELMASLAAISGVRVQTAHERLFELVDFDEEEPLP
jgi:hypothetical protein